ncbi:MAG: hypothetical protein JNJ45_01625 [Chthonomonas sp.]|nr:hypothetical protein [Chthonomonas sp.]
MKILLGVAAGFVLVGCGGSNSSWWPMEVGKEWTYVAKSGLNSSVEVFRVRSRVPVAGREGFEIVSDSGPSHLVWNDGKLLANRLAGTSFVPALPIYSDSSMVWKGTVETASGPRQASAEISTTDAEYKEATRTLPARKTTLTIGFKGEKRVLTYLYVRDLGLVQHEEFVGMSLVRSLLLTKGPAGSGR